MPYFEVRRYVLKDEVVLVEAEDSQRATEKAQRVHGGEVQDSHDVEVRGITTVKGEEDFTNA